MKKIFLALFVVLSMFFVSCGSSDSVKEAINDTSIFSQDEINYVNNGIEEMKQSGYTFTSTTINSTTMKITGTYIEDGNIFSFSEKIEKKNGLVVDTYINSNPNYSSVNYELTIPRVFDDFDSNDYFTSAENTGLSLLLHNNGLDGINTGCTEITPGIISLDILLGSSPNYTYEGKIIKDNNKYYFLDSTGIIGSADTLEALISNTSVKNKLTKVIYSGTYSGTYTGGDSGTWNITVNSDGSITGTTTSDDYGPFTVTGTLSGNTATLTATSGATLTTTISSAGVVNGTWSNSSAEISGSLTGNKK